MSVSECVIAELFRRRREKLTVALRTQEGVTRCHIRLQVMAAGGRWRETRHGVTVEPGRLGELIAALCLARRQADERE